jgi:chloramphenicol O-acetyltransferase type A
MSLTSDRQHYFDFFSKFHSPYLNLTWELKLADFSPYCQRLGISRFQWLIYNLCRSLMSIDAFMWRLDEEGKPVQVSTISPSYTVLNPQKNFNFTNFSYDSSWPLFLERSLRSKGEAEAATRILVDEQGKLDYIFITTLPWMKFTSIQHPIFDPRRVHIPSFAFGAFEVLGPEISFPFSVQAHHGFVDGYHLHLLDLAMKKNLSDFSSVFP